MNANKEIKRGEIYSYDFGSREGSIQSRCRPVLILQSDEFNKHSPTVIVAVITSSCKKHYLPSHVDLGEAFGLRKPSMVLLEQVQAVNKCDLRDYIGRVDDSTIWKQINNATRKTFGFWKYKDQTSDIRCLCSHCLSNYFQDTSLIVRRADPFLREKDRCEKCDGFGYNYIIYKRKKMK